MESSRFETKESGKKKKKERERKRNERERERERERDAASREENADRKQRNFETRLVFVSEVRVAD